GGLGSPEGAREGPRPLSRTFVVWATAVVCGPVILVGAMRHATPLLLLLVLAVGCATGPRGGASDGKNFYFFAPAVADNDDVDPWYPKVVEWQGRLGPDKTEPPVGTRPSLPEA